MREFVRYTLSVLRNHLKEGIIIFYPFLLFLIYSFALIEEQKQFLKENLSVLLSAIILFSFYVLFRKRNRKHILAGLYLFFALGIFLKISFYILYETAFSSSGVFIIFETNLYEAMDFVEFYMNPKLFILLFLLILPLVSLIFIKFKKPLFPKETKFSFRIFLIAVIAINTIFIFKKLKTEHILSVSLYSYLDYLEVKKRMIFDFSEKFSTNLHNVKRSSDTIQRNGEELHIVVIGESTTNWHLQLYGYHKETNPLLQEIKDELFVFDSVISPHTHTILSLEKMLSLSNFENPVPAQNASVVQLVNQAGFTSYWISNQRPVGFHESVATNIARAADKKYFITASEYGNQNTVDEFIFPVLEDIVQEPSQKKVVFIQLIGTHAPYHKRYPDHFSKFDGDKDNLLFSSGNAQKIRNQYDNAVLYNDYIIRNLIEFLRNKASSSSLIYFSDHGDDVFDTMDFAGHNEYHATAPMYEIPFIIWLSESKRAEKNLLPAYINRRYNSEDLIHTLADLLSIDFDKKDNSRSVINPEFKERTRWIKEGIDYDNQEK